MKNERNILDNAELKANPFTVPEGYFENLKTELKMIPKKQEKTTKVVRWKPFVSIASIAAVVAALIAAGAFFLEKGNDDTGFTVIQGDNDFFADIQNLTEDDIIEYLISTGVELEDIEQY